MKRICILLCAVAVPVLSLPASAQTRIENKLIDYAGFREIVNEMQEIRESRRLTEAQFLEAMSQPGVVLLDARSADPFARRHLKGAVNLPFTDFTAESLAKVIPSKNTRVLIYCNNNFTGDSPEFRVKAFTASLNLSTQTSLRSYGYTNVHELGPAVDVDKTMIPFAGSAVAPR